MITFEMSNCVSEGKNFFFGNILNGKLATDDSRKAGLALESREGRVVLLKTGFSGKDIESLYLKLNGFVITGVNWQE